MVALRFHLGHSSSDETRVHGESARNRLHARNKLQANKLETHDKLKAWNCLFSGLSCWHHLYLRLQYPFQLKKRKSSFVADTKNYHKKLLVPAMKL